MCENISVRCRIWLMPYSRQKCRFVSNGQRLLLRSRRPGDKLSKRLVRQSPRLSSHGTLPWPWYVQIQDSHVHRLLVIPVPIGTIPLKLRPKQNGVGPSHGVGARKADMAGTRVKVKAPKERTIGPMASGTTDGATVGNPPFKTIELVGKTNLKAVVKGASLFLWPMTTRWCGPPRTAIDVVFFSPHQKGARCVVASLTTRVQNVGGNIRLPHHIQRSMHRWPMPSSRGPNRMRRLLPENLVSVTKVTYNQRRVWKLKHRFDSYSTKAYAKLLRPGQQSFVHPFR